MSSPSDGSDEGPLPTGPTDFDHPNSQEMDEVFPPTVNLEHIKNGNIRLSDVELVKIDKRILLDEALILNGDPEPHFSHIVDSTDFTVDRLIEQGAGGFLVLAGRTERHIEYGVPLQTSKGGILSRWRKKKEPETATVQGMSQ